MYTMILRTILRNRRVELLRSLGISYKEIENAGYALPVVSMQTNYKSPDYMMIFNCETIIKKTLANHF